MVLGVRPRHDVNVGNPRVPQSQDSVCVEEEKDGSGELEKWESFAGSRSTTSTTR